MWDSSVVLSPGRSHLVHSGAAQLGIITGVFELNYRDRTLCVDTVRGVEMAV